MSDHTRTTIDRESIPAAAPTIFDATDDGQVDIFLLSSGGEPRYRARWPIEECDYPRLQAALGPGDYRLQKVREQGELGRVKVRHISIEPPPGEEKETKGGGGAAALLLKSMESQIAALREDVRRGPEEEYRSALKLQREEQERSSKWLTTFFEGQRERDTASTAHMQKIQADSNAVMMEAINRSNKFALQLLTNQLADAREDVDKSKPEDPLEQMERLMRLRAAFGDLEMGDGKNISSVIAEKLPEILDGIARLASAKGDAKPPPDQLPSPEQDAETLTGGATPPEPDDQAEDEESLLTEQAEAQHLAILAFWVSQMKRLDVSTWGDVIRDQYAAGALPPLLIEPLEAAWTQRDLDPLRELFEDIDESEALNAFLLFEARKAQGTQDAPTGEDDPMGSDSPPVDVVDLDAASLDDERGPREDADPPDLDSPR